MIREELDRILRSTIFAQSERLGRFLRFTVEAVLQGRAETLKEYVIGTDVYDRQPPYHPSQDSIVRTEARRLRAKLREYYDSDGKVDHVLIYFRPGSYVPVFRLREALASMENIAEAVEDNLLAEGRGVPLAVLPFESDSTSQPASVLAAAITDELIHELMHTDGCRVTSAGAAAPSGRYASDLPALAQRLGVHAIFEGSVRQEAQQLRVTIRIIFPDGFQLWSQRFETGVADGQMFRIAERIARSVINRTRPELSSIRKWKASSGTIIQKCYPAVLGAEALLDEGTVEDIQLRLPAFRRYGTRIHPTPVRTPGWLTAITNWRCVASMFPLPP